MIQARSAQTQTDIQSLEYFNDNISAHNQILAHARAYRLYQTKYAQSQGGKVGITLNIHWAEPEDPNNIDHIGEFYKNNHAQILMHFFRCI